MDAAAGGEAEPSAHDDPAGGGDGDDDGDDDDDDGDDDDDAPFDAASAWTLRLRGPQLPVSGAALSLPRGVRKRSSTNSRSPSLPLEFAPADTRPAMAPSGAPPARAQRTIKPHVWREARLRGAPFFEQRRATALLCLASAPGWRDAARFTLSSGPEALLPWTGRGRAWFWRNIWLSAGACARASAVFLLAAHCCHS